MPKRNLKGSQPKQPEPKEELLVASEKLDLSSDDEVSELENGGESQGDDGSTDITGVDEQLSSDEEELRQAFSEYVGGASASDPLEQNGIEETAQPVDPGSDSSEDERPNRNTVGAVPLVWYKNEEHIGYDREGSKLVRRQRGDKLDALLARNDSKKALRTIYDEYNDEEITLTKEELDMLMRIRKGQFPHVSVNPYEPYNDWFSGDVDPRPINNAPEPKRRFIPSKHEEKKIVALVRAIRKGWIKTSEQKVKAAAPPVYLLWDDDNLTSDKTAAGLTYIPAPKLKLPGHEESYNPAKEYLPTEEERQAWQLMDPEDRPTFVPEAHSCLRQVPAYAEFIKERFERCLDLYLAPRVRRKRMLVKDPQTLVPKLPKPRDLQPFPTTLALKFLGHQGKVRCVQPDSTGQWLATGGEDGTLRVWQVSTGRCMKVWELGSVVHSVAWSPTTRMLAAAAGKSLMLMAPGVLGPEAEAAIAEVLKLDGSIDGDLVSWLPREGGGIELLHKHALRHVTWHAKGDYFATVAPTGQSKAVLVHQLSKRASQNPFRKNNGRVSRVLFHPTKPLFFVAGQNHVRVYNLAKQELAKKLVGGSGAISCMAVHPGGDHIITGAEDTRLAWYDLDLSTKPYRALRYHKAAVRGAAFHRTYPLFASSADDGAVHVFHGMVYNDLMTNPLIVPVKVLRGHSVVDYSGVIDCAFHPTQPWIFTAGADSTVCLWCN